MKTYTVVTLLANGTHAVATSLLNTVEVRQHIAARVAQRPSYSILGFITIDGNGKMFRYDRDGEYSAPAAQVL